MRRIVDWVLLLAILAGGAYAWYVYPNEVKGVMRTIESKIRPCASPITYSIGHVDSRFGISTKTLALKLGEAVTLWEGATDKDLFAYREKGGDVTVNLVYDERQAATDKLKSMGLQIDKREATYEALKKEYGSLLVRVESKQALYDARSAVFESEQKAYNEEVAQWNERGGAPPAAYRELEAKQKALEAEFNALKALERDVNEDIETLNALATTLNQFIVQLSLNVDQYNREGAAQGEYEAGLYQLSGGIRTIDIYEYSDATQFVRILTHELGHALGLEHVEDTAAIMHHVNTGAHTTLTPDDVAELNHVCSSGFL